MFRKLVFVAVAAGLGLASPAMAEGGKNWHPPAYKIYAQKLSDEIMAAHPDLFSVTFHGVPPGMHDVYTMYAGSYPKRIGNSDDPDDIMVSKLGITIIDPRWHRYKDTVHKFVMMVPLRERDGENIGLLVLAYNKDKHPLWGERQYTLDAMNIRDELQLKVPSLQGMFAKAE